MKKTGKDALLAWAKQKTQGYPGVEVTNFSGSWRDGLALCALIHSIRPSLIPWDNLKKADEIGNLNIAFTAAERIGVPKLLDAEDMSPGPPEPLSVITYLGTIYHAAMKIDSSGGSGSTNTPAAIGGGTAKPPADTPKASGPTPVSPTPKPAASTPSRPTSTQTPPISTPQATTTPPAKTQSENASPNPQLSSGASCKRCGKPASGVMVDWGEDLYHQECFKCTGCSKAFKRNCLNIDGYPYCDTCGRKAFVQSRLIKNGLAPAESLPGVAALNAASRSSGSSSSTSVSTPSGSSASSSVRPSSIHSTSSQNTSNPSLNTAASHQSMPPMKSSPATASSSASGSSSSTTVSTTSTSRSPTPSVSTSSTPTATILSTSNSTSASTPSRTSSPSIVQNSGTSKPTATISPSTSASTIPTNKATATSSNTSSAAKSTASTTSSPAFSSSTSHTTAHSSPAPHTTSSSSASQATPPKETIIEKEMREQREKEAELAAARNRASSPTPVPSTSSPASTSTSSSSPARSNVAQSSAPSTPNRSPAGSVTASSAPSNTSSPHRPVTSAPNILKPNNSGGQRIISVSKSQNSATTDVSSTSSTKATSSTTSNTVTFTAKPVELTVTTASAAKRPASTSASPVRSPSSPNTSVSASTPSPSPAKAETIIEREMREQSEREAELQAQRTKASSPGPSAASSSTAGSTTHGASTSTTPSKDNPKPAPRPSVSPAPTFSQSDQATKHTTDSRPSIVVDSSHHDAHPTNSGNSKTQTTPPPSIPQKPARSPSDTSPPMSPSSSQSDIHTSKPQLLPPAPSRMPSVAPGEIVVEHTAVPPAPSRATSVAPRELVVEHVPETTDVEYAEDVDPTEVEEDDEISREMKRHTTQLRKVDVTRVEQGHQGFLKKRDRTAAIKLFWTTLWFSLKDFRLLYYKEEQGKNSLAAEHLPEGFLSLQYIDSIRLNPKSETKFIVEGPSVKWDLNCSSKEEAIVWVDAMNDAVTMHNLTERHKRRATSKPVFGQANAEDLVMEGKLDRQTTFGWQHNWWLLQDGMLFYFQSQGGKRLGRIPLYHCEFAPVETSSGKDDPIRAFCITSYQNEKIILAATDEMEMHRWLNCMLRQRIIIEEAIDMISF